MGIPSPVRRRLAVPLLVAVVVAALDLGTKAWAQGLAGQPPRVLIPGLLRIELQLNPGIAFGVLGRFDRALVVALGALLLAYLLWLAWRLPVRGASRQLGLGLMLGGAGANLYDRAFGAVDVHGLWGPGAQDGVIDFIVLTLGPRHAIWPAFNVADAALALGAALVLLTLWRLRKDGTDLDPAARAQDPSP